MAIVSYDLAIWEGHRPADDAAAQQRYEQLYARYMSGKLVPPTPRIAAFVHALLGRYPEIDAAAGDDSPWATGPLMRSASGPLFYLPLVYSQCDVASAWVAHLAERHGLVCYDVQVGKLRP